MKFLHIADVHLGCTRYQLAESPRDFFDAWVDVLRRYGIEEKVDLVVIAGDFFHKRSVPPEAMDHAVEGLTMLRDAGIPVIAVEGNHDQKYLDSKFSWLRSLSKWGLLKLLEPKSTGDEMIYEPWDEQLRQGGYVDVGRARIFGSDWYGTMGNVAIPMLTRAIKQTRREGAFHILLLHTDVEGHQVHPIPALSADALNQLKTAVEYVALGHTHKHYEIDNWAFNPGSIEITNISEHRETRGAFIVEVDADNHVTAHHVSDYVHRPFQQLIFAVDACETGADVADGVLELVRRDARSAVPGKPQPIIEISLRGRLGFPNSTIDMSRLRDDIKAMTNALHVRIKNHTIPVEFKDLADDGDDPAREHLERRVIDGLVLHDNRYRARAEAVADAVIGAKRMALSDEPAEKIAEFISQIIVPK
ncbi:MAG: exonuclease SbcCD subunit D [Acidobacteria bacterium]|nr:exonuclease SbcCD subunit D [Acidobacteriota bacterium]